MAFIFNQHELYYCLFELLFEVKVEFRLFLWFFIRNLGIEILLIHREIDRFNSNRKYLNEASDIIVDYFQP